MSIKEFFVGICLTIPLAIWVVFLFLIVSYILGADSFFYFSIYCKVAIYLIAATLVAAVFCQTSGCCKREELQE